MAMGTEGVGFWFRGPNNYVRNNVAANYQNPTTEAAYGFVFQFRYLGNIAVPNFKGADTIMATGQSTTMNGNNMPLLQFENNEAYGAMQGGFTLWWVSSLDPQPSANAQESVDQGSEAVAHLQQGRLHVSRPEGHLRRPEDPGQLQLGAAGVAATACTSRTIRRRASSSAIPTSRGWKRASPRPRSGFGPEPQPHDREFVSAQLRQRQCPDQRVGQRLLDGATSWW